MALNRIQAARLLNGREMALFESSLAENASQLDARALSSRIRQLRTQRDKFRDLHQRQRVATRARTGTKAGASGSDNARTEQKAQAFDEALHRLERQQTRLEAAQLRQASAAAPARRPPRPANAPAGGNSRRAAAGGKASERPIAASGPPRRSASPRPSRQGR